MGDRSAKLRWGGALVAAVAGGVLAAGVATAQGPGDYQPTTSTSTTTLGGPGPGQNARFELEAKAKVGPLKKRIVVYAECSESCTVQGRGRLRLSSVPRNGSTPFALKRDRVQADDGTGRLRLKVPKLARRIAGRKSYDGNIRAKLTVVAANAAGKVESERLGVVFDKKR